MFANTEVFFILLAFSLAVGGALGAFYDALLLAVDSVLPQKAVKRQRTILPHNAREAEKALFPIDMRVTARDVALFFTDIIFCTVSALAVIILLYHLNYGEVRAFSLISAFAGFVIYRKTIGRPLLFLMKRVIILLKKVLKKAVGVARKLFCILFSPIKAIAKRTVAPVIEVVRERQVRKRARKYLLLMEENEDKRTARRKQNNERDKSISAER